jgi:DNA-binding XRE family transcriptional regulator
MPKKLFSERDLASLAKECRIKSGKTKIDAAKELNVGRTSIQLAEENPDESLTSLRIRIIERYSPHKVVGPLYRLEKK